MGLSNLPNEIAKQEVMQQCHTDLLFLGKVVSPQTFKKKSPDFHYEVAALFLNKKKRKKVIQAPRGTAKSSLSIFKVINHISFDEGDKVVVLQSKTLGEAKKRLNKVKNILSYSAPYIAMFGDCGVNNRGTFAKTWREDRVVTRINGFNVTIQALGTGQQIRGVLEDDARISLLILDDPDDENNCGTKEQMEKNFDAFFGALPGLEMETGEVIVIGTPIREMCIVDRLFSAPDWEKRYYKLCDEETDELLWPEKFSLSWYKSEKSNWKEAGKLTKFYSEYQCTIVGDEDKTFKDWKTWDGSFELNKYGQGFLNIKKKNGIELPIVEKLPVNFFVGIDPASSTKSSADYSVTFIVAYDANKNIYCLYYYRKRVSPLEHAEQIIDIIKSYKPTRGCVETVAYQEMLRQYLRQRLNEEGLYLSGLEQKWNPRTEKSARLESLQPFFASNKIWVKEEMKALEEELNMYPRGKHDDLLDGLYYATRMLITPDHSLPEKESNVYFLPREYNEINKKFAWMN
jgi:predicted phage terminase large subunit-like protein